jgi:hypothetical protein
MRSGSTLLCNILNTNPEIISAGEFKIKYHSDEDFKSLIFRSYRYVHKLNMPEKYVIDKLCHNYCLPHEELLLSGNISKFIFLIREPSGAFKSLLGLKELDSGFSKVSDEKILTHYLNRLPKLEEYSVLINNKQKSLFVTNEQLVDQTELSLKKLQDFLELKLPLSESYKVSPATGMYGRGDISNFIKSGRIVRDRKKSNIEIPQVFFEKGKQAFEQCCNTLSQYCTVIDEEVV